jgi:hypothetical protein
LPCQPVAAQGGILGSAVRAAGVVAQRPRRIFSPVFHQNVDQVVASDQSCDGAADSSHGHPAARSHQGIGADEVTRCVVAIFGLVLGHFGKCPAGQLVDSGNSQRQGPDADARLALVDVRNEQVNACPADPLHAYPSISQLTYIGDPVRLALQPFGQNRRSRQLRRA